MLKALWISRHIPQIEQVEVLTCRLGIDTVLVPTGNPDNPTWVPWAPDDENIQVVGYSANNNPYVAAQDIKALMDETGASEFIGVLPIGHLGALTKLGICPLRADMTRIPTGEVTSTGEVEYRFEFERFQRIVKVEIVTEDI